MDQTRKLWLGLAALLVASFSVLLWMGGEIHRQAPPMPEAVVTDSGVRDIWPAIRHACETRRSHDFQRLSTVTGCPPVREK